MLAHRANFLPRIEALGHMGRLHLFQFCQDIPRKVNQLVYTAEDSVVDMSDSFSPPATRLTGLRLTGTVVTISASP